jgi:hypothetical protein
MRAFCGSKPPERKTESLERFIRLLFQMRTMKMTLTLRPTARFGMGPALSGLDRVVNYEVVGLPPGQFAEIAEIDQRWQIWRTKEGVRGRWAGDYSTAEAALEELRKDFLD